MFGPLSKNFCHVVFENVFVTFFTPNITFSSKNLFFCHKLFFIFIATIGIGIGITILIVDPMHWTIQTSQVMWWHLKGIQNLLEQSFLTSKGQMASIFWNVLLHFSQLDHWINMLVYPPSLPIVTVDWESSCMVEIPSYQLNVP
jgi:hypothetical protein